jgi:tetratricopeptide (TPR) repeat protein
MIFKDLRLSAKIGKVQALLIKKEYRKAIYLIDTVLSHNPPNYLESTVLIQKGEAEFNLGNNGQALMSFKKAINIYKKFPKAEVIDKDNKSVGRAVNFIEYINTVKT